MGRILYQEEQRFTQLWLWAIMIFALLSVLGPFIYGLYSQEILNKPFGDQPMSTEGLIVTGLSSVVLVLILIFIFGGARLKTKITNESLLVAYPPFFRKWKIFMPDEIEKYEVRVYKVIREYGGYGIKRRIKYGQAYTVSGNVGLQLYFKNGKKLLIGTQKKQAIKSAMEKLMDKEKLSGDYKTETITPKAKFFGKTKKFLFLLAFEIVAILIFVVIQFFKGN